MGVQNPIAGAKDAAAVDSCSTQRQDAAMLGKGARSQTGTEQVIGEGLLCNQLQNDGAGAVGLLESEDRTIW
jgi:hypothetical protein